MADELARRAEARVGRWLRQKWHLDRLIGIGGMAAVYSATHRNGKRGAVKLLHLELSLEKDARERFLREGYVANKVGHPGAVVVLDDDVAEDGSVYLVMELLEGASLIDLLEQQKDWILPTHAALSVVEQLLAVLASAHDAGIVHRDIKPENVFVTNDGRVKLLDFGIARLREGQSGLRTQTGHSMGTPAFMPPEQAAGKWASVGPHSDIWAVGATLFNMMTGRTVHEAETVPILMVKAITLPAPALASVLPGAPSDVALIVDRALAFDPANRFETAGAMRAAVKSALGQHHGLSLRSLATAAGEAMESPETSDALTLPESKTLVDPPPIAPARRKPAKVLLAVTALGSIVGATAWLIVGAGGVGAGPAADADREVVSAEREPQTTREPASGTATSAAPASTVAPMLVAPASASEATASALAPRASGRPTTTVPKPSARPPTSPYEIRKPQK